MTDDKHIDDFMNCFKDDYSFPQSKKIIIMKINGRIVRTRSGKSSWANIGHAKNALRHHCWQLRDYRGEKWQDLLQDLQDRKILEFVTLESF